MIVRLLVLAAMAAGAAVGMRKLQPVLDRLEEDVQSDGYWRPL